MGLHTGTAQEVMTPKLLWKLGRVSALGISKDGKNIDSVDLNSDGTVTKNGETLAVDSDKTFTNAAGSVFESKQTQGFLKLAGAHVTPT